MGIHEVIETDVYAPGVDENGDPTGYLKYIGQRSLGEVLDSLERRLAETRVESGGETTSLLDAMDSFGPGYTESRQLNRTDDFPSYRWIACFAVEGSNEGHYVHVQVLRALGLGRKGMEPIDVFVGKTFMGLDVALAIANALTRAFYR